ncbi:MAG: hypothetical protein ABI891_15705 [Acidobacteriota bacterium]
MDDSLQKLAADTKPVEEIGVVTEETVEIIDKKQVDQFRDLARALGFEDGEGQAENDYEIHYHTAVAYQEMGLTEDAIKEFQDAISLVTIDDGTRRFFQCSNLLGHCFMEKQMPNLALMWFKRCLEVAGLQDEEKQALYYELGNSYEAGGTRKRLSNILKNSMRKMLIFEMSASVWKVFRVKNDGKRNIIINN